MKSFHPFQIQALEALQRQNHVICIAPTGAGKSLIYEHYARHSAHKTLLVTPLLALQRQQIKTLTAAGVNVCKDWDQLKTTPKKKPQAWICSPEKLFNEKFRTQFLERLVNWKPDFLVVDECHCIWDWGDRFRPAFQKIPELVSLFKIKKSLWLSATLSTHQTNELKTALPGSAHKMGNFSFPENLTFRMIKVPRPERMEILRAIVLSKKTAGIIFCATRNSTLKIGRIFSDCVPKLRAVTYHAGLSQEERLTVERRISEQSVDVVIATSAFGMGMDFQQFRWGLFFQASPSMLYMAQASGRIGRNGSGEVYFLWDEDDFRVFPWLTKKKDLSPEKQIEWRHSEQLFKSSECVNVRFNQYFNEKPSTPCGKCTRCVFRF